MPRLGKVALQVVTLAFHVGSLIAATTSDSPRAVSDPLRNVSFLLEVMKVHDARHEGATSQA